MKGVPFCGQRGAKLLWRVTEMDQKPEAFSSITAPFYPWGGIESLWQAAVSATAKDEGAEINAESRESVQ